MTTDCLLLGKAAEHLVIAHCLREGLECYTPVNEGGRIDVIVGPNLSRCQIKLISRHARHGGLPVRKSGGQNYHEYRYTAADVDFMVGVDFVEMDVYVVPIAFALNYSAMISLPVLKLNGFKNNFAQFAVIAQAA